MAHTRDPLERAITIAVEAHRGQRDKAGAPYVLHPLRVMFRQQDPTAMIAAALHDVVEDTCWTLEALRDEGFEPAVLEALDALTRRESESYEEFVERAMSNPVARSVKLADLEDNLDLRRLADLKPADVARMQRYLQAWKRWHDRE